MSILHGGLRGDATWEHHSDFGRFLAIHPVHEVIVKDCMSLSSEVTLFSAEARYGMHLGGSDAYWRTPEDAMKQAILRARAKAGAEGEYAEQPTPRFGPHVPSVCLLCEKQAERTKKTAEAVA